MQQNLIRLHHVMGAALLALTVNIAQAESALPAPPPAGTATPDQGHSEPDGRHGPHERHGRAEHHLEHKLAKLGLTPEQHDKIRQLLDSQKPLTEQKWHALHDNMLALRKASTADNYDPKQVQDIANQQAKLQAEILVNRTSTIHQVFALLTPQQKQKWLAEEAAHEKEFESDHGHGQDGWHREPGDSHPHDAG